MEGYAEKIYVLVHHCHEQCLRLMHAKQATNKEPDAFGVNTRQGIILKMLLKEENITQKELTRRLEISSSSCGELLTKLEQRGYLKRQSSKADKRTYTLAITENGRRLAKQYQEKYSVELEKWASALLTLPEEEQLFHLLTKLSAGLEEQMPKGKETNE